MPFEGGHLTQGKEALSQRDSINRSTGFERNLIVVDQLYARHVWRWSSFQAFKVVADYNRVAIVVRQCIAESARGINEERPYESLGNMTPIEFAAFPNDHLEKPTGILYLSPS